MSLKVGCPVPSLGRMLALSLLTVFVAGCGETAEQRGERAAKQYNLPKETLGKFSGTVTIDNQPPQLEAGYVLLLVLYNAKDAESNSPKFTAVQPDGHFDFSNGVPAGSYVALFVALRKGRPGHYRAPDALKNRFNDPDVNDKNPQFKIEITDKGKTDQTFNLVTAGKEAVSSPGPNAFLRYPK